MRWVLAAGVAAWASAAPALAEDESDAFLTYLNKTSEAALHAALPAGAPSTWVQLSCLAGKNRFTECTVVSMNPAGSDAVGQGAIKLALEKRFSGPEQTGKDTSGRRFRIVFELLAPGDRSAIWLKKPNLAMMNYLVPGRAAAEGVGGSAALQCDVTVEGYLDHCVVVGESRPGYGFGEAALTLKSQLAMTPAIRNGQPAPSRVAFSVGFPALAAGARVAKAGRLLTDPLWASVPTAAALRGAYPAKAAALTYGQAALRCNLSDTGQARSCRVTSELPAGRGFGTAALGIAPSFVLAYAAEDAKYLKDFQVDIALRFRNPTSPDTGVLTEPRWTRTLSAEDAQRLFPAQARSQGVATGLGTVNCAASVQGELVDCRVLHEAPAALGFGQAAMEAARLMQMNPWTKDGEAVEGRRITLPIRFNLTTAPSS